MYQTTSMLLRPSEEQREFSDAHCHLTLFEKPGEAIAGALRHGVKTMITAGGSASDNSGVAALAKGSNVFGVVGISPDFVADWNGKEGIAGIIKANKNIVGIGEVGLDFKIIKSADEANRQKEVFAMQIELAAELNVPLVVHSRLALREVMSMLEEHSVKKAMFHFFEGDADDALRAERDGYLISIPPTESKKRKRAIAAVDLSSILVETDSPVVGKTPYDVEKSIGIVAKAKNMSAYDVGAATTKNLKELFYI